MNEIDGPVYRRVSQSPNIAFENLKLRARCSGLTKVIADKDEQIKALKAEIIFMKEMVTELNHARVRLEDLLEAINNEQ